MTGHISDAEFESMRHQTRSHLINAWTSRKGQRLVSETLETQPNHHFPAVSVGSVLWLSCHKTLFEITSSYVMLGRNEVHVMHVLYVVNCF
jgi:hypothetical protein